MTEITLKKTLWNKFVCWLLSRKVQTKQTDYGLQVSLDPQAVIREFEGTPITGPKAGVINWLVWAFFLNELDGVIGDRVWNPERKDTWKIKVLWWLRNPCHNFTWHVIGFAQENTTRVDFQQDDGPGWNLAMSLVGEPGAQTAYPYALYLSPRIKFYIGWRGKGTFGIKFNIKSVPTNAN